MWGCITPKGQPPNLHYVVNSNHQKICLLMGICGNGTVLGQYVFENNLNGRTYLEIMNNFVFPGLLQNYPAAHDENVFENIWWSQDVAPAHRKRVVRDRLTELFPERLVALGHNIKWPARSPDLTPCDIFLWGHLKQIFCIFTRPWNVASVYNGIIKSTLPKSIFY